ncbi:NAD(P)H-binding protein [Algoriphagus sp. AGSA1]|uniref:NAD(P)H-binding protein n=1 Tax=Algoriphagus sp. AGSA1 TaxID=2907213 RepID=UPI001F17F790|nr:NAD(P)H-binding protein [Algoriphagus sp. AGSA1]MCE7053148.1 NAD(P)H-binding protein [Algoriphagus sp. AGSA1]
MKILIIGASGRVGKNLTKILLDLGHTVIGTSRQNNKLFAHSNYRQIELDITEELDVITKNFPQDVDAVYFVSGSRGKNLLQIDLHGAVKTMQAAENRGIKRYIMLSAIHSLSPSKWKVEGLKNLTDYYLAKHYADLFLINQTKLNFTILQPGALIETKGSGLVEVNIDHHGENSIENVAEMLSELLKSTSSHKKVISMHDGTTPIAVAIEQLS